MLTYSGCLGNHFVVRLVELGPVSKWSRGVADGIGSSLVSILHPACTAPVLCGSSLSVHIAP